MSLHMQRARAFWSTVRWSAMISGLAFLIGCGALDVNDPHRVLPEDFKNALGADLAIEDVRRQFHMSAEDAIQASATMTDEFFVSSNADVIDFKTTLDRRNRDGYLGIINATGFGGIVSVMENDFIEMGQSDPYRDWQSLWIKATVGISFARQHAAPNKKDAYVAEMFAMRGFAMVNLAEQICPGFPVRHIDASDLSNLVADYASVPLTTDSAFKLAVAQFDSALAYSAPDSAQTLNFARLGKARALLGQGRFADAATVATLVDPNFTAEARNDFDGLRRLGMVPGSREAGEGLEFAFAGDPRVPTTVVINDPGFFLVRATHFQGDIPVSVVIASGLEARLIRAEAALVSAPGSLAWLDTLNALRSTMGLADTTDPGTADGRRELFFRERAFWLYGTAHRLGDLRRLIHHYGRNPETVFPSGQAMINRRLITYGAATSIAFADAQERLQNAAITGCTGD